MTTLSFDSLLTEGAGGLKLGGVDLKSLESNFTSLLKTAGVKFKRVDVVLQSVFGGSKEIQMRFDDTTVKGTPVDNFRFQISSTGDVTANASSKSVKNLVTLNRVGHIKSVDRLTERRGLLKDIIDFTVQEILDNI